jgi:hypothetical protein
MSEEYDVQGSTEVDPRLIPAGRFKFEVIKSEGFTSRAGNPCTRVFLKLSNDRRIEDVFVRRGKIEWRWRQFLWAVEIRRSPKGAQTFTVTASEMIGKTGMVDIIIKEEIPGQPENSIRNYSPEKIEEPQIKAPPEPPETVSPPEVKPTPPTELKPEPEAKEESEEW